MLVLGIETSCDETGAAIVKDGRFILSNIVASQIRLHQKYGGVVPEVAARKHIEVIIPVIKEAFGKAKVSPKKIDALAVCHGPGLIPALMIGVDTAKALAWAWEKPICAINHLEAHIYANWLDCNKQKSKIDFPLLCLIASGGHTELILMKNHGKYKSLGSTRDDAAGEAFDKVAKLLGLGYPGGPIIAKLANLGNSKSYSFPRPMIDSKEFDFSFSGLKTDVLRLVIKKKKGFTDQEIKNICASFQKAVIDCLVEKTIKAAKEFRIKNICLAGGVAANKLLRRTMAKRLSQEIPSSAFFLPQPSYCTDNAAMVAAAGFFHAKIKKFDRWDKISAWPNLKLE